MSCRIAIRTLSGGRVRPYLFCGGQAAKERGKKLAQNPCARAMASCVKENAGNRTAIKQCMAQAKIKHCNSNVPVSPKVSSSDFKKPSFEFDEEPILEEPIIAVEEPTEELDGSE